MFHWTLVSGAVGLFLCVAGAVLGWYSFPSLVNDRVKKSIVLEEGTEQYERFVTVPQPLLFKVHIFNVTNPDEVQQGELPIVQEIGPIVYKQYRQKSIKEFSNQKTTVTYTQRQSYVFDEELSKPWLESDKVTVLNMHMNAFIQELERELREILKNFKSKVNKTLDRTPVVRIFKRIVDRIRGKRKSILQIAEGDDGLAFLLPQINLSLDQVFNGPSSMFITTTIREYLFDGIRFCINTSGIAQLICKQIKDRESKTIRELEDGSLAFSFFHHKNSSIDGVYQVNTGMEEPHQVFEIEKINESEHLSVWMDHLDNTTSVCNQINGTDASGYPPFRKKGDDMYIYSSDICRSVQLFYEKKVNYKGIPGYRYTTRENFLNQIGPEYSNECFCVDKLINIDKKKNGCLYSGALDLSNCLDAPVVLTLPHMLGAAEEYTKLVKGLKPDREKHQIFIDVQDLTGTPLQGGKRVQFNMFLKPISRITLTQNLPKTLVPAVWVEEGIELNDKMVSLLQSKLINTLIILDIVHWTLFAFGLVIFLLSGIFYFVKRKKFA